MITCGLCRADDDLDPIVGSCVCDQPDYEECMKQRFKYGQHVRLTAEAQEHYKDLNPAFRVELIMRITNVAVSTEQHPGFDEGVGEALYDLQTAVKGKAFPCSLYDYELEPA